MPTKKKAQPAKVDAVEVVSDAMVIGNPGDVIPVDELAGLNIDAAVRAGHVKRTKVAEATSDSEVD